MYCTSGRSNKKPSLHGALETPVISKSIDTKSASLTAARSSASTGSKFDLVTFFSGESEEEGGGEVQSERVGDGVRNRVGALKRARTRFCFGIFAAHVLLRAAIDIVAQLNE